MKRQFNLDYLRGLAAFGIMMYHYTIWTQGPSTSADFIGRVGVYGVAIFYVLSGLTLSFVYADRLNFTAPDLWGFAKKRILRILPLLWLVTICSIWLNHLKFNWADLALNFTGLFGFVTWDKYYATGLWSIGNEWVFYAIFPFLVFAWRYRKWALPLLLGLLVLTFVYFTFYRLNPAMKINKQWHVYTNPLNQVYLFALGFIMPFVFKEIQIRNRWILVIIATALGIFYFLPVTGNQIQLVTGWNRVILSLCCLLICWGVYKLRLNFPKLLHTPLVLLGEASYSIYLLHPLVFVALNKQIKIWRKMGYKIPHWEHFLAASILTLIISCFVYNYFEKFFMKLGKR